MKRRVGLGGLTFILSFMIWMQAGIAADERTEGGMVRWPLPVMSQALDVVVPAHMEAEKVSGVAIAVVKNGHIVYRGNFGLADRALDVPVTSDTLFEAGDLGAVVAAYGAMTMVRDKLLFLDAPLSRDLNEKWLQSEAADKDVTLRRVLSHMSGLGDNKVYPSRKVSGRPGEAFFHSSEGFLYLQYVMAHVAGKPFEQLMRARVFEPLGMARSTFIGALPGEGAQTAGLVARGYVPVRYPLALFFFPFIVSLAVAIVLMLVVLRVVYDEHRPEMRHLLLPVVLAFVVTLVVVTLNVGYAMTLLVTLIALGFAMLLGVLILIFRAIGRLLGLDQSGEGVLTRGRDMQTTRFYVVTIVLACLTLVPLLRFNLPVKHLPFGQVAQPNVSLSFRTSANDMGRFMIELLDGQEIGRAMRSQIFSQQTRIGKNRGWAMGLGIQRNDNRITYWERGATPGYVSLMVLEPARQTGVVVLTNSSEGGLLTQAIMRDMLGIEAVWALP
ncbi:MAG: serine hydrolase [Rhizobiales bacterium]|nr:serine hydrolase [Hyphomicrobiales bacterium]